MNNENTTPIEQRAREMVELVRGQIEDVEFYSPTIPLPYQQYHRHIRALIELLQQVREEGEVEFKQAKEWNDLCELELKNLRSIVQDQDDQLDLNRDEFLRIKACPGADDEIKQLCDRSQQVIVQRVPVIEQRDNAKIALAAAEGIFNQIVESLTTERDTLKEQLVHATASRDAEFEAHRHTKGQVDVLEQQVADLEKDLAAARADREAALTRIGTLEALYAAALAARKTDTEEEAL